jgi:multiple sugar transport system substrate-binding protein
MTPLSLRRRGRPFRRNLPPTIVLLAGALALAACGGVGGGGGGDGTGGGVTLTTMGFGTPDEVAQARLDAFREEYPDVELEVPEGAFDEQQFLSSVASNDPPDLVYLDREKLGTYAARGALTPLDDCLADVGIDLADYREQAAAQVQYDGQVYGVPEFHSVRVLLLNTDALAAAGLSPDTFSTADWDAVRQAAQAMTVVQGNDLARIGFDPKIPEFLPLWTFANGGQLISDDGSQAMLDSPEAVEALEFTASVVEASGGYSRLQPFRETWDFFGAENQFATDQLGGMPMEDWYLNVLAETSPEAPVVARPFLGRDGQPVSYGTGQAWAVPDGADNVEEACQFMATMTADETWMAAAQAKKDARDAEDLPYTGTWTGKAAVDEQIMTEVYEPTGVAWLDEAVQVVLDLQPEAVALPATPAGAEIKKAWEDAANSVLGGEATPAEALQAAQQEAQEAIDRALEEG